MTLAALGMVLLAPARSGGGGVHISTTIIVIIAVVAVLGMVAIVGWREKRGDAETEEPARREDMD
jgi:hypothetical protein